MSRQFFGGCTGSPMYKEVDDFALFVEMRFTVGQNRVSSNCLSSTSQLQLLQRPNQEFLSGLTCTVATPDCPVLISPQAGAALLCAMTSSPEKKRITQPLSRKQECAVNVNGVIWRDLKLGPDLFCFIMLSD